MSGYGVFFCYNGAVFGLGSVAMRFADGSCAVCFVSNNLLFCGAALSIMVAAVLYVFVSGMHRCLIFVSDYGAVHFVGSSGLYRRQCAWCFWRLFCLR